MIAHTHKYVRSNDRWNKSYHPVVHEHGKDKVMTSVVCKTATDAIALAEKYQAELEEAAKVETARILAEAGLVKKEETYS